MTESRSTVIYDDMVTEVSTLAERGQLWVEKGDLTRSTRFELKAEGVCRDELCYPLPSSRQYEFLRDESGKSWFNLTALAQLMGQAVAHDSTNSAWYFGVRADQRGQLACWEAPDFTLPDIDGKLHSLSDFRGKKVFLVTWASW